MADRAAPDDAANRRLMARIAARDRRAFEEFYRANAHAVLAFVSGIVAAPDIAEEIASDAMITVWESADRFAGRSRVMTWVLGIAHHKAIDRLRRRKTLLLSLDSRIHAADATVDRALASDDALERVDDRLALEHALRALSVEHRTVLQLMFGFDCSQAEIAQIVGCPVATVKTRVFYAKRRLREELERTTAAGEIA